MHEASLIASLLRQVDELAAQNGGGRIDQIRVEVGPLAGVEPLLLREAFCRLRVGTSARDAELVIDVVGLTCRCRECRTEYVTEILRFDCPTCGCVDVDVTAGDCVVLHSLTLTPPAEASVSI